MEGCRRGATICTVLALVSLILGSSLALAALDVPGPGAQEESRALPQAEGPEDGIAETAGGDSETDWIVRRAIETTERFLGRPYVRSPLGEGEGVDPDPRYREDAFDCLTLVETAIALAHAEDAGEEAVLAVMDDLRYVADATPHFQSRLHLMEAQWIPESIRKGYVEDVTATLGGAHAMATSVELDAVRWSRRRLLGALPWLPELEGVHEIAVIPLDVAIEQASSWPDGLLLNVVRQAREGFPTVITHTGLLHTRDGARYVRHASLGQQRVVDEPLLRFLGRHAAMRRWEVRGVHLLRLRDNRARSGHVVARALRRPSEASPTVETAATEDALQTVEILAPHEPSR